MRVLTEGEEAHADIYLDERPHALLYALEWHLAVHLAACGRRCEPSRLRTWEVLADELAERFPPHLWHPRHWDVYDQAHPPRPDVAPPAAPPVKTCEDPRGTRTPRRRLVAPRLSAQATLWKEE